MTVEPLPPIASASAVATSKPEPAKPEPTSDGERMESYSPGHELMAAIVRIQPELRRCYNDGLKTDPKMQGTIRLRIKVAADGTVADVAVDGPSAFPASVEQCMIAAAKTAAFPAPGGNGSTLVLPLNFVQAAP